MIERGRRRGVALVGAKNNEINVKTELYEIKENCSEVL